MVSPAKAIDVSDYRRTCKPVHEKMHASDNRHLVVIAIITNCRNTPVCAVRISATGA